MNHAKLEASRYTVFLIPVCTGGLRAPDRGSGAVRLRRKVADTASRSWGAPQRQGASDGNSGRRGEGGGGVGKAKKRKKKKSAAAYKNRGNRSGDARDIRQRTS